VRVRLLIDVETSELDRLQRYVGEQPAVGLRFAEEGKTDERGRARLDWVVSGRFVGAKDVPGAEIGGGSG
jgi:hypothetical protein